jgi:hypothetical protein
MGNDCKLCYTIETNNELRAAEHQSHHWDKDLGTDLTTNKKQKENVNKNNENARDEHEENTVNSNPSPLQHAENDGNIQSAANGQNNPSCGTQRPVKKTAVELSGGIKYEGEWMGGLKHGKGVQIWPDGAQYEG